VGPEARACDVTGWTVIANEGPCLALDTRGAAEYRATNTCDEALTLTDADCVEGCAAALELKGSESGTLKLPSAARNGQTADFRYAVSGEESTLSFEYVENVCPGEDDGGCAIAPRGDARYAAELVVLLLLGVGFWARRGSACKMPTAPKNIPVKSGGTCSVASTATKKTT
jgi:hypothetical protein